MLQEEQQKNTSLGLDPLIIETPTTTSNCRRNSLHPHDRNSLDRLRWADFEAKPFLRQHHLEAFFFGAADRVLHALKVLDVRRHHPVPRVVCEQELACFLLLVQFDFHLLRVPIPLYDFRRRVQLLRDLLQLFPHEKRILPRTRQPVDAIRAIAVLQVEVVFRAATAAGAGCEGGRRRRRCTQGSTSTRETVAGRRFWSEGTRCGVRRRTCKRLLDLHFSFVFRDQRTTRAQIHRPQGCGESVRHGTSAVLVFFYPRRPRPRRHARQRLQHDCGFRLPRIYQQLAEER
mmetsp:Transcript_24898/g.62629  ORF Transcript_24898/g.62629 Transcript_24898/m.62629 type:complete len:288 (+) Transcript_24898:658-1521(+)